MWFLEIDKLFIITLVALFICLLRILNSRLKLSIPIHFILPIIELGVLFYISKKLAVFYAAYIIFTYVLSLFLYKSKVLKKVLFFIFCIVATLPFFYNRIDTFGLELNNVFVIIGISYSMFKVIDAFYHVYYSEENINFIVYVNYILFLPVFTAGPIHRYREFKKSLLNPITIDMSTLAYSIQRIIKGLFKKVVVAELILLLFKYVQTLELSWYISLSLIAMSYALLYFDLSGYSDVAIGFSALAGIATPENFKKPWAAPTMTQFWRNWHVTLSDFIREHIYVVLVKKKLNKFQGALIGLVTMIIMALWHGFNIPYLIAGVYLGLIIFFENIFSLTTLNKRTANKVHFAFRCLLTNFLFALNTLVFTLPKDMVLKVILNLFSIR